MNCMGTQERESYRRQQLSANYWNARLAFIGEGLSMIARSKECLLLTTLYMANKWV
jgi:hypothetical protein